METQIYTSPPAEKQRQSPLLVVEDNPDQWKVIQSALQRSLPSAQPVWATGIKDTLAYLDECMNGGQTLPKLILLDLYLPKREQGWKLLRILKVHPACRYTPVVMLSYSDHPDDIRQAYQEGGTSYIVKPTDYPQWLDYFQALKTYWWDAVTLPKTDSYR